MITISLLIIAGFIFIQSNISSHINIALCKKETTKQQTCFARILENTLAEKGLSKAFDVLALIYATDEIFAADCHGNTHELGKTAYQLFHKNKEIDLTPKASYCGFGFYHGFMEELLYQGGTMEEAREFCAYVDKTLSGISNAKGSCYHGIGHGVVDGTDTRAWGNPEAIITPGLTLCEQVGEDERHKGRCASGVFNSLAILYERPDKYNLRVVADDPYRICENQSPDYFKRACYDEMNTLVLRFAEFDFKKAVAYILKIPETTHAVSAADSLAGYAAKFRYKKKLETAYHNAIKACRLLPQDVFISCIRGFGGGLVEFGEPEREYEESLAFCQTNDLNSEEQKACLHRVLNLLAVMYPKDAVVAICERYVALSHGELCNELKRNIP